MLRKTWMKWLGCSGWWKSRCGLKLLCYHKTPSHRSDHLYPGRLMYVCTLIVAKLHLTLCDPTDCSPPGSSVHGISKASILEWVAISFSMESSWPRDWTRVSLIVDRLSQLLLYHLSHQGVVSPDKYFKRMKAEWGCCQEIFKNIWKYKRFCSKQFYIIIKDSSKLNYWISR